MSDGVLVATDLDRTLIYSLTAAGAPRPGERPWVVVERLDGRDISHITELAAARFAALAAQRCVVPVTTRTPAQLARVQLPARGPAGAVAGQRRRAARPTGEPDPAWATGCAPPWPTSPGNRGGAPHRSRWRAPTTRCPAVRRPRPCSATPSWTGPRSPRTGWPTCGPGPPMPGGGCRCRAASSTSCPRCLTKSAAVAEVADRAGARWWCSPPVDSLLDTDLLEHATLAVRPGHGELADAGGPART